MLIGNSVSYSIDLSNTGSSALRITSTSVQGSAFSFGTFHVPVNIKPGASVELPIIFTPTALGHTTGVITLVSTALNPTLTINVSGIGVVPQLKISPASFKFGNVVIGSSATLPATLTASNAAITITSEPELTNSEFAILGLNPPVTIPIGQSIYATIQFTPSASGKASGQAVFTSNAANSPTVKSLTGTGVSHYVSLSWDAGDDSPAGYNVYRGTAQAGPFARLNTALDTSTNYTDYTVAAGATYFYVTTELSDEGVESDYSNEAEAVIPSP